MSPQEVQMIASRSLNALSDNRVMVPSDASEALADLKSILRQLMSGQAVIIFPQPKAAEDDKDAA